MDVPSPQLFLLSCPGQTLHTQPWQTIHVTSLSAVTVLDASSDQWGQGSQVRIWGSNSCQTPWHRTPLGMPSSTNPCTLTDCRECAADPKWWCHTVIDGVGIGWYRLEAAKSLRRTLALTCMLFHEVWIDEVEAYTNVLQPSYSEHITRPRNDRFIS